MLLRERAAGGFAMEPICTIFEFALDNLATRRRKSSGDNRSQERVIDGAVYRICIREGCMYSKVKKDS